MNIRLVGNYLGKILLLECVFMVPALLIAVFAGEDESWLAFLMTMVPMLAIGGILLYLKSKDRAMYAREGFVIVALSWVIISVFGAIPFTLSGAIPNYLDALFETISGFTTTGATILGDIESLPMSMLYWRSFTHWLGGMGVLVFILAIAPAGHGSGMPLHILRAESPGPTVGKLSPKLHRTARLLYAMYFVLTLAEVIVLMAGKLPFFDALTTSFGSAGTGGFAIRNDSLMSYSPFCQTTVAIFMMLFGVNFNIYFLILIKDFKGIFKNSELRLYLGTIAAATAGITLCTLNYFGGFGKSLHHAFFQVSSIITTTGFVTNDFNKWPEFSHEILMLLMIIGACAGSTGGGLKVSRVLILFKSLRCDLKKLIHPHSVTAVKLDGKFLEKETVDRCSVFFFVYMVILIVSTLLLSIESQSFKTNITAVLACLNNIGPGMDAVGPVENFSFFAPGGKIILMLNMLLGRLEIFPMLLLFAPSTWKLRK